MRPVWQAAAAVQAAVPELPDAVIAHRFSLDAAEEDLATAADGPRAPSRWS